MILNCLKTKEPYVGPKSDCQISPIFLPFWWVLSYIFRLLSPIFLYFWTPKVLDTLDLLAVLKPTPILPHAKILLVLFQLFFFSGE